MTSTNAYNPAVAKRYVRSCVRATRRINQAEWFALSDLGTEADRLHLAHCYKRRRQLFQAGRARGLSLYAIGVDGQ